MQLLPREAALFPLFWLDEMQEVTTNGPKEIRLRCKLLRQTFPEQGGCVPLNLLSRLVEQRALEPIYGRSKALLNAQLYLNSLSLLTDLEPSDDWLLASLKVTRFGDHDLLLAGKECLGNDLVREVICDSEAPGRITAYIDGLIARRTAILAERGSAA